MDLIIVNSHFVRVPFDYNRNGLFRDVYNGFTDDYSAEIYAEIESAVLEFTSEIDHPNHASCSPSNHNHCQGLPKFKFLRCIYTLITRTLCNPRLSVTSVQNDVAIGNSSHSINTLGIVANSRIFGLSYQVALPSQTKSQLKNTRAKLSSSRRRLKMPAVARPLVNNTSSNFMPKRVTVLHELFFFPTLVNKRG